MDLKVESLCSGYPGIAPPAVWRDGWRGRLSGVRVGKVVGRIMVCRRFVLAGTLVRQRLLLVFRWRLSHLWQPGQPGRVEPLLRLAPEEPERPYLRRMLEPQTLRFLTQLKTNNNKPWFDAHRAQYEAARIDFANFIQLVIDALQKNDTAITGQTGKECMFRINRDIRFSNDKTPYKAHFGASIKRGGKKSPYAGYYFHCEPGGLSFIGGGLWQPEAPRLKAVRQEIDYNFSEFKEIIGSKDFKKTFSDVYQGKDVRLSTMPKGYEKVNPAAEYLRLKSFIAETKVSDEELTTASLHKKSVAAFVAMQPFLDFLNRTAGE